MKAGPSMKAGLSHKARAPVRRRLGPALAAALLIASLAACSLPAVLTGGGEPSPSPSAAAPTPSPTATPVQKLAPRKPPKTVADAFKLVNYERDKNPDTVGWLVVPGTDINDSVVQSHDNLFYLRLDERKQQSAYGCYFADYECSFGPRDKLSPNTVIYGHSDLQDNPDGPKFSQLFRFTEEGFAREHPTIQFTTRYEQMTFEIFAVFYTGTDMGYTLVNLEDAALSALISEARGKSLYDYGAAPAGAGEKLLTLSTCTVKYGERKDQRFVVMARLLPADAEVPAKAELQVNPDPIPAFPG